MWSRHSGHSVDGESSSRASTNSTRLGLTHLCNVSFLEASLSLVVTPERGFPRRGGLLNLIGLGIRPRRRLQLAGLLENRLHSMRDIVGLL